MADPYKILGVSRDASDEEIKKAYRALSRKYPVSYTHLRAHETKKCLKPSSRRIIRL